MTVYVSRNATTGELRRDLPARASATARPDSAGPPLLTHAWRVVFERQARERNGR